LKHEPSWYLKKLYYDAVGYHGPALKLARELVGAERIMFGTDNPFFPPLTGDPYESEWESVKTNVLAAEETFQSPDELAGVMGENAIKILDLH
jgi:aminocarboxymuconate-semialdehyde decarboxylase